MRDCGRLSSLASACWSRKFPQIVKAAKSCELPVLMFHVYHPNPCSKRDQNGSSERECGHRKSSFLMGFVSLGVQATASENAQVEMLVRLSHHDMDGAAFGILLLRFDHYLHISVQGVEKPEEPVR